MFFRGVGEGTYTIKFGGYGLPLPLLFSLHLATAILGQMGWRLLIICCPGGIVTGDRVSPVSRNNSAWTVDHIGIVGAFMHLYQLKTAS